MCDITLDNFDAKYHEINHSLHKANFVAIDTEFTGLHLDSAQPSLKDTANERYKKLKKSIQTHNIVQIGLSTFRYCNEQRVYVNDSYNFYLFPRSFGCSSEFICTFQSSCADFLCRNKFDFNKLFYKGISYLNNKQEKQLENSLKQELLFAGIERDIDERQLQKVCSEIADWLLRSQPGDFCDLNSVKDLQPALVLKELRNRFDSVWAYQVENKIIVEHVTLARKKELELSEKNDKNKLTDSLLGFTKIFRLLIEYKKPIIVHNGFMDLLYLYEKFYEPLPDSIKEFKKNINHLFPLIYDTKLISIECKKNDKQMKELYDSTVLENLYTTLNRQVSKKCFLYLPSVKNSPHSTDYSKTARPHEAAYDAYMCGTVFLKLAHAITTFESKQFYNVRPNNMNDYFLVMKPYENKINLIKASLDYINLFGPDPIGSNTKILFIKSKSNLSIFELLKRFTPFGYSEVDLKSKNTALVTVDSQRSAEFIIAALENDKSLEVSSYNIWKHNEHLQHLIAGCAIVGGCAVLYWLFKR